MNLDDYQNWALRTCGDEIADPELAQALALNGIVKGTEAYRVVYQKIHMLTTACGIGGEGGEVSDLLKKHVGHGHPLDRDKVKKELGDCLWYIAVMADAIGEKLSDVAEANVQKLLKRYPAGFDKDRSINRPPE